MMTAKNILFKEEMSREDLVYLLGTKDQGEIDALFAHARKTALRHCENKVSLRGLIEISNKCKKNCLYCGIRAENTTINRYSLSQGDLHEAADYAWKNGFASVVIQSGEREDKSFTNMITESIRQIKKLSNNEIGITLSCGEQSEEVYREWFDAGAHRYLLRIESSSEELYYKIHPNDEMHDFRNRMLSLKTLQRLGYQTGTGVMIGLPHQSLGHLADDLLFMKNLEIDMVGMGPYIPHPDTPLYRYKDHIPDEATRLDLSLRMIALLRIMMKDINIAASTALQTLSNLGRVKAIASGANVFMPNLTPADQACNYSIYTGKPVFSDMAKTVMVDFEEKIEKLGYIINYNNWGDSKYYQKRIARNE